jgi:hypothetical protein
LVLTLDCGGGKQDISFGPGPRERVCAKTAPGAALTIKAAFCLGSVDQSPALKGTFTADQKGFYAWNWTPVVTCEGNPPGATGYWKGKVDVTASLGGQTATQGIVFEA